AALRAAAPQRAPRARSRPLRARRAALAPALAALVRGDARGREVAAPATLALWRLALCGQLASPAARHSARHYLAAALFCALGLLAQQRWRAEAWQPGRWLAPLSFSVALLCAEAALARRDAVRGHRHGLPRDLQRHGLRRRWRRRVPLAHLGAREVPRGSGDAFSGPPGRRDPRGAGRARAHVGGATARGGR